VNVNDVPHFVGDKYPTAQQIRNTIGMYNDFYGKDPACILIHPVTLLAMADKIEEVSSER
jgi:hypothetical protein